MSTPHQSTDQQLRERAQAVIPGGMYGHQVAPGAATRSSCGAAAGRGSGTWTGTSTST